MSESVQTDLSLSTHLREERLRATCGGRCNDDYFHKIYFSHGPLGKSLRIGGLDRWKGCKEEGKRKRGREIGAGGRC